MRAQSGAEGRSRGGSRGNSTGCFRAGVEGGGQGSLPCAPAALLHPIDRVPRDQPGRGRWVAVIRAQLLYAFRSNHRSVSLELPEIASHADMVVAVDARARLEDFL